MAQLQVGTPVLEVDVDGTTAYLTWTQNGRDPNTFEVLQNGQTIVRDLPRTARSYTVSGLIPGATYTFRVKAVKGGFTELSNPVTVTIPSVPKPIIAPVLQGTAGDAQVSLSWNSVADATAYELQRKTGAGAYATLTPPSPTTALAYINTGLTNTTQYTYRVRGTATGGDGPWSNEVARTPTSSVPVAPTLTGTAGDSQNSLDWNAVANAATYRIRFSLTAGGPVTVLWNTDQTDYVDDAAVNGETRYYTVRGVTAGNVMGAVSNELPLTAEAAIPGEPPTVVGWASGSAGVAPVTGGDGGNVYQVTTIADYLAKLALNENRIIDVRGTANFIGAGQIVDIDFGNLTIIGSDFHGSFRRLGHRGKCNNVKLIDMRFRPGDQVGTADDVDGFTISGTQGHRERWLLDHCSLNWGPDMAGIGVLDDVTDVTLQYCTLGPGLAQSAHSEGHPPPNTHHKSANFTTIGTQVATVWPQRITVYRSVMFDVEDRAPQIMGPAKMDLVNCITYNCMNKAVHGNPRSLNMVGCFVKKGPGTSGNSFVFRSDTNGSNPNPHPDSVFLGDGSAAYPLNVAVGFTYAEKFDAGVKRPTPNAQGLYAVTAANPNLALFQAICDEAGARPRDSIDIQHMNAVKASGIAAAGTQWPSGAGGYYNGTGYPAPNPSWPAPF